MTRFSRNLCACILTVVVSAFIQLCSSAQAPTKPPSRVPLNSGVVQGSTYKNDALGLELISAPGLQLGTPEMKGPPGEAPHLVTVSAWGEKNLFSVRAGTVFYAEALANYPENNRSTETQMHGVVRANKNDGFELVKGPGEEHFNGVSFSRSDFRKNSVYEAVFVKACDAYALVFIFTGPDPEAVSKLIAQTRLKLDSEKSGCHNKSDASPLKD